ncbi:MAG TPA: histidine phosphatase family protein [Nitrospira sp.]|nr:histidine phosphatase family protein [Nitrospira sp.]
MDCILFRHGIAIEREEWDGPETDRPLTERGIKRVSQVAAGLRWLEVQPTYIFSSPLVRALETADILQASLSIPSAVKRVEELLPDANPERLLALFRDLPPECCVLCVGHEPHLGSAASAILAGKPSEAFPFKKAGACLIELSVPPKIGRGVLRWWMEPGQLRALGKKRAKVEDA